LIEIPVPTMQINNKDIGGKNNNNKNDDSTNTAADKMWAWIVPTVLFILIVTGMIIMYKRRRESM